MVSDSFSGTGVAVFLLVRGTCPEILPHMKNPASVLGDPPSGPFVDGATILVLDFTGACSELGTAFDMQDCPATVRVQFFCCMEYTKCGPHMW